MRRKHVDQKCSSKFGKERIMAKHEQFVLQSYDANFCQECPSKFGPREIFGKTRELENAKPWK